MAYQLPVKSTVWVLPPPPPPCPPRLPEALALLSARMLAIKEPSRVVAEANLLGKKYLIIQNGKLGGFSFLQLGTTIVLFGVLRAFQILICFYQKKGLWKEFGPVPYYLGPHFSLITVCNAATMLFTGGQVHSNPACLPVQSLQRQCLSPGGQCMGRTLKVCLRV